jgi:transcriptional regulator with XRE-family HTH domain
MEQAAHQADIHRVTLHRWEKGRVQPCLPELKALLAALGASPQQRRQALTLVDAPRAQALVRLDRARIAERSGFGPLPHGGDLLRAMRLRRGWSLEQIAAHLGVTSMTIRRWEAMETWPSAQQLHRLCYALEAKVEEMLALTCGQFARTAPRTSTGTAGTVGITAKALAERVEQFARTLLDPPFGLKDLELLTLQAEAWTLAARSSAVGIRLLAEVYGLSSRHLAYRDRAGESVAAAERYFDLVPDEPRDPRTQAAWLELRLGTATTRLHVPGRTTPKRCLEELRWILPHARGTENESDALIKISEVLLQQGAQDEALSGLRRRVSGGHNDEEVTWARGNHGIQLIRSGRYEEGLPLLSTGYAGDWYRLVDTSLWKAEALVGLGEKAEAERWLTRAQSDLAKYEITGSLSAAPGCAAGTASRGTSCRGLTVAGSGHYSLVLECRFLGVQICSLCGLKPASKANLLHHAPTTRKAPIVTSYRTAPENAGILSAKSEHLDRGLNDADSAPAVWCSRSRAVSAEAI